MNTQYRKTKVVSDNPDIEMDPIEAYTDGSKWNGWLNVAMTEKQLSDWLDQLPYDYKFNNTAPVPFVTVYFDDEEKIESSPLFIDGELLTVYFLEGFTFMEEESS